MHLLIPRAVLAIFVLLVTAHAACAQFTTVINVPPDAAPAVVGSNTQVNVLEGGIVDQSAFATIQVGAQDGSSTNAELNVTGGDLRAIAEVYAGGVLNVWAGLSPGSIGRTSGVRLYEGSRLNTSIGSNLDGVQLEAGAIANIQGGFAYVALVQGGVLNVEGNSLLREFQVYGDGVLNLRNGSLGFGSAAPYTLFVHQGGAIHISGGQVSGFFEVKTGGKASISGGTISGLLAVSESVIDISGGAFGAVLLASSSQATIRGGDFRLDGVPIAGLETPGQSVQAAVQDGLFTGVLADGTPFAFSRADSDGFIAGVALTLVRTELPTVGPLLITAPHEHVPLGIRQGQTLIVKSGGVIGRNFIAAAGSTVRIEPGATVDQNFEAVGADVEIRGGTIMGELDAFAGSDVRIYGGDIGSRIDAFSDSIVTIAGGSIRKSFGAWAGSEVQLVGREFLLNHQPIPELQPGVPFTLTDRTGELRGILSDGSPLNINLGAIKPGTSELAISPEAHVTLTLTPVDGDFNADGFVDGEDLAQWAAGYGASGAATHLQGDADYDLDVDGADFLAWQRQSGSAGSASAPTAVPEPAALVLTIVGSSQLSCWRRRPNTGGSR